jgi:hypothetical protein
LSLTVAEQEIPKAPVVRLEAGEPAVDELDALQAGLVEDRLYQVAVRKAHVAEMRRHQTRPLQPATLPMDLLEQDVAGLLRAEIEIRQEALLQDVFIV